MLNNCMKKYIVNEEVDPLDRVIKINITNERQASVSLGTES